MSLASMCHDRTRRTPVVSLSKAKSTEVVTTAGESNTAPGVMEVKRSALRAVTRLEYQELVIIPRVNVVASSKQGGDGCWLTMRRQTAVTVKGAAKKYKS